MIDTISRSGVASLTKKLFRLHGLGIAPKIHSRERGQQPQVKFAHELSARVSSRALYSSNASTRYTELHDVHHAQDIFLVRTQVQRAANIQNICAQMKTYVCNNVDMGTFLPLSTGENFDLGRKQHLEPENILGGIRYNEPHI